MNPRVSSISEVKPFSVTVIWTNGQVMVIDFNEFLAEDRKKGHPIFSKLFHAETFLKVKTDGRTLYWDNLTEMLDEEGKIIPAPLDFCPDVLYQVSKEIPAIVH